ncbi:MAG: heparinase II/III family protein [Eubacteriales bacterium]|nr:heparinase II/III family protein [Eubacteriales bacterium]
MMLYSAQQVKAIADKTEWHRKAIEKAKAEFEIFSKEPILTLPYDAFVAFEKTGDRPPYDTKYFPRRGWLNKSAILAMVYDDEPKYLEYLQNIIWAICDEASWASPPHFWDAGNLENILTHIDLFAAETGHALSEINHMLGDRLEPWVKTRIDFEVRRRIIEPFKERKFHWETCNHNWAAVCAGCVGMAYMYTATREEFDEIYPRFESAMESFLTGYGEDGCCHEGAGYWNYGFGYYVYYADLLRKYTDGEIDLFRNEKVHQIAKFQERFFLTAHRAANFSDCGPGFAFNYGKTSYFKKEYSDIIVPPYESIGSLDNDNCHRWANPVRSFLWADVNLEFTSKSDKFCYLPDAQWYIKTTDTYSLAARSGRNDESHNHNDIGSFIFLSGDDAVCDDPGPGKYDRDYFSEKRYENIKASSAGHNLPIVDGKYQIPGDVYGEVIEATEEKFVVEIARAYGNPKLKSLVRTLASDKTTVTLTDKFETEGDCPLVERFVTTIEPVIEKGLIKVGQGTITGDFDGATYTRSDELYLIDIPVNCNEFTVVLK